MKKDSRPKVSSPCEPYVSMLFAKGMCLVYPDQDGPRALFPPFVHALCVPWAFCLEVLRSWLHEKPQLLVFPHLT